MVGELDCPDYMKKIIDNEKKQIEGKIIQMYYILPEHLGSNIPDLSRIKYEDNFWAGKAAQKMGSMKLENSFISGKTRVLEFEFQTSEESRNFLNNIDLFGGFLLKQQISEEDKLLKLEELPKRLELLQEIHCNSNCKNIVSTC